VPTRFDDLGCDFKIYVYHKDDPLEHLLIEEEGYFWHEHVLKNKAPDPQYGHPDDFLKAFPTAETWKKVVSYDEMISVIKLQDTRKQIQELKEQEVWEKEKVLNLFGDTKLLVDPNGNPLATCKNRTLTQFDKRSFAEEHPDLMEKFTLKGNTRNLNIIHTTGY
jgi:predicted phage-related endonuclease